MRKLKDAILQDKVFLFWFLLALFFRGIASATHNSWQHSDDWFQTLEYAHLFTQGVMSYTQEVSLHLRNLTWPFLLTLPLRLATVLDSDSIFLRLFLVQFYTSLFSLSLLFFWRLWIKEYVPNKTAPALIHFFYGIPVLSWFVYSDFIQPSQENISIAFLFLSLCFIKKRSFFWAAFFALAMGCVRYPNGLFSLGILAALATQGVREKNKKLLSQIFLGALGAVLIFGLADFYVYGRPYESFWMYVHYNGVLSLGERFFGAQSALEYWNYISGHFLRVFSFLFYPVLVLAMVGSFKALQKGEPWAWGAFVYLMAHLWIGHKEGRFMRPLEFLMILAAMEASIHFKEGLKFTFKKISQKISPIILIFVAGVFFYKNFIYLGTSLWGSNFKSSSTYLEVDALLERYPEVCAVMSVRLPASVLIPKWTEDKRPIPSMLFLRGDPNQPLEEQFSKSKILMLQEKPQCEADGKILFHFYRTDPAFMDHGCELLETGVLRFLPKKYSETLIKKRKIHGPWYLCSATLMDEFKNKEVRVSLVHEIQKHSYEDLFPLTEEKIMNLKKRSESFFNLEPAH